MIFNLTQGTSGAEQDRQHRALPGHLRRRDRRAGVLGAGAHEAARVEGPPEQESGPDPGAREAGGRVDGSPPRPGPHHDKSASWWT